MLTIKQLLDEANKQIEERFSTPLQRIDLTNVGAIIANVFMAHHTDTPVQYHINRTHIELSPVIVGNLRFKARRKRKWVMMGVRCLYELHVHSVSLASDHDLDASALLILEHAQQERKAQMEADRVKKAQEVDAYLAELASLGITHTQMIRLKLQFDHMTFLQRKEIEKRSEHE